MKETVKHPIQNRSDDQQSSEKQSPKQKNTLSPEPTGEAPKFFFEFGWENKDERALEPEVLLEPDKKEAIKEDVQITTGIPKVAGHQFRSSGSFSPDNKAVNVANGKISKLGLDGAPTVGFHNAEEIIFQLDANGGNLNDYTFEIKRAKTGVTAELVAGKTGWVNGVAISSSPDGPSAANTQLIPNNKGYIYSVDAPGLPFSELSKRPSNVTGLLQMGNFEEHIEIVNKKTGARTIDTYVVKWHAQLTLLRNSVSLRGWMMDATPNANQVGEGHITLPK